MPQRPRSQYEASEPCSTSKSPKTNANGLVWKIVSSKLRSKQATQSPFAFNGSPHTEQTATDARRVSISRLPQFFVSTRSNSCSLLQALHQHHFCHQEKRSRPCQKPVALLRHVSFNLSLGRG